jgi:misacylated tRNA(Ala) deacylase
MATEALFQRDAFLREFEAVVTSVTPSGDQTGAGVVLDRTAFYAGGGGQPCDIGMLAFPSGIATVTKVSRKDGEIVHELEGDIPAVGTQVTGTVDWDNRHALMRTHTALHILCGVIWREYRTPVTGGNMTPLAGRMDFEFENITADFAEHVEALANAEIDAARDITVSFLPRDAAMTNPDLIRTKINLLPEGIPEVRVVDIRDVGRIRITGHESKGKINKRLRLVIEDASPPTRG